MKKRLCHACGFKWDSDTAYGPGESTKCPRCGADVPGDSLVKTVRA